MSTIFETREDADWHCRPSAFMRIYNMTYTETQTWLAAQWWGPRSIVYQRMLRGDFDTTTGELRNDPDANRPL